MFRSNFVTINSVSPAQSSYYTNIMFPPFQLAQKEEADAKSKNILMRLINQKQMHLKL